MAKAPKPGVSERADATKAAQVVLRITVDGETREIAPALVPIREKLIVRKATKLPFEAYYRDGQDSFGEDSLLVLWWLAGRQSNPMLTWDQAMDAWPSPLTEEILDVEEISPDPDPDPDEDSPEG